MNGIPWVEKYRPFAFDQVILNRHNRLLLTSVIKNDFSVNLLFYGPPGTGKTTTITSMIKDYLGKNHKGLVMYLNASDDRGIEMIRNQIYTFATSDNLFNQGKKIVVLDEADYMTKIAQIALKLLIETTKNTVRFIVICNYISKIERSLQDILIQIRFNHLPKKDIIEFLSQICKSENINLSNRTIENIQSKFGYDIRSMINYIQFNNMQLMMYQNEVEMAVTASEVMNAADMFILEMRLRKDIISIAQRKEYESDVEMVCALLEKSGRHIEMRTFWIDTFCEFFLNSDVSNISLCDQVKKFVHNSTMSARDMHYYCFHLLCQSEK